MLNEKSLRELLAAGHLTSDGDFVDHTVANMARTVYLMAYFLGDPQHGCLNSRELQDRIKVHLRRSGLTTLPTPFNPVDWFSAEWTQSKNGHPSPHFKDEYHELFVREGTSPISYRISGDLCELVGRILLELGSPVLTDVACELDREGAFAPRNRADARRWDLRAVVVRQGQPRFRADLLDGDRAVTHSTNAGEGSSRVSMRRESHHRCPILTAPNRRHRSRGANPIQMESRRRRRWHLGELTDFPQRN